MTLTPLRCSIIVWPLRPVYSTALEATPSLPSATARVSPLRAPPVSLAPCQPRAAVPESDNSAFHLFPAPRSVDGIASHVTLQFLHASADSISAVHSSVGLTCAVHAPTDLTSAVHASADLTSAVHASVDLTSAAHASADLALSLIHI